MKITFNLILFLTAWFGVPRFQQAARAQAWIYFKDKGPDWRERLIEAGESGFWHADAWERRYRRKIPFDYQDAPVYPSYLQAVGGEVKYVSRWLNAAYVVGGNVADGVEKIVTAKRYRPYTTQDEWPGPYLGQALDQLHLIRLDTLWGAGWRGRNVRIAVFDSGFDGYPTIPAFAYARSKGQPLYKKDFVDFDDSPFDGDDHGTRVLSVISAFIPDTLVGGATEADLILIKTEDVSREVKNEEYQWVAAAEWVETLGTDIIQSAVGYTTFDDHATYAPTDLDGQTAAITLAADAADAAGILVVQSAGNEAGNAWNNIIVPCDGRKVLCVGSVRRTRERAATSSHGPTADGRVKPEVMALGAGAAVAAANSAVLRTSGTSFAAPAISALAAALMQSNPQATHRDVFNVILQSADRFQNPDAQYGYGIPDGAQAFRLLNPSHDSTSVRSRFNSPEWVVYDSGKAFCLFTPTAFLRYSVEFYDLSGKTCASMNGLAAGIKYHAPMELPIGAYIVKITTPEGVFWKKGCLLRD
jgi:subtilisin family serine protease